MAAAKTGLRRKRGKFNDLRHVEEFERDTDQTFKDTKGELERLEALIEALDARITALEP